MSRPTTEQLEALANGELTPAEAADLERRVAADDDAAAELAWLRAERAMMDARADREPPLPAALWAGVEHDIARAAELRAQPWWRRWLVPDALAERVDSEKARWFGFGLATAAAAAVVMLIATGGHDTAGVAQGGADGGAAIAAHTDATPRADEPARGALADATDALANAELAHLAALDALEVAYRAERDSLEPALAARYDEQFRTARSLIEQAQALDPTDLHARRQLLAAYSVQLRTLQSAVIGREEVR